MREIEELLPEVVQRAASLPEPTAIKAIRDVARDFCERTKVWKERDRITVSDPDNIGLNNVPDAEVVIIQEASLDGQQLTVKDPDELDVELPGWEDVEVGTSAAKYLTQLTPNTVTIVPKATGILRYRAVMQPTREAMTLPDFLVQRYGSQIGLGAAGVVLTLPDTGFGNPTLGGVLLRSFESYINRIEANRPTLRPPRRTRAHFF